MAFVEIDPQYRNLEGVRAKYLKATLIFVDFSIAFESIYGWSKYF